MTGQRGLDTASAACDRPLMSTTPFLESLRVTYPDITPQHTRSFYDEGLREAADFGFVSAADVKVASQATGGAPVSIVLAGKIKAAAEAARTNIDDRAARAVALRSHVGNLMSTDPDVVTAALDGLAALGVEYLPSTHGKQAVPDVALELFGVSDEVRRAAQSAGIYRGLALVPLADLRPRRYAPRSPASGELLQAGKDWRTGVEWGQLRPIEIGLARWMKQHGMTGGLADAALFADLHQRGPASSNANTVRCARGVTDAQLEALAEASADPGGAPGGAVPASGKHTHKDVSRLLLSLFSADELRRWLRYLPGGGDLMGKLPGANASPASLASEAVAELDRAGMIDEDFWQRLRNERPHRVPEILRVRDGGA